MLGRPRARLDPAVGRRHRAAERSSYRQVLELDLVALVEDDQRLDLVLELPDVARPGVAGEGLHRFRPTTRLRRLAVVLGEDGEEVLGEQRDVARALPERGDVERHDLETVVEVLAEAPDRHLLLEVPVGRRDQAEVDVDQLRAADPHDLRSSSTRRSLTCSSG
jgi:hypothetical protein